jgi:hypothetical protein
MQIDLSALIESHFTGVSANLEKPEFALLTGGVCAGKTTLRRSQFQGDYVQLDAAEIFLALCAGEYFEFGDQQFESFLDFVGSAVAMRAVAEQRNIVTEIIGAAADTNIALLEAMHGAGYDLSVQQLECNEKVCWERNVNRDDDNISAYFTEPYHVRWLIEATREYSRDTSVE